MGGAYEVVAPNEANAVVDDDSGGGDWDPASAGADQVALNDLWTVEPHLNDSQETQPVHVDLIHPSCLESVAFFHRTSHF